MPVERCRFEAVFGRLSLGCRHALQGDRCNRLAMRCATGRSAVAHEGREIAERNNRIGSICRSEQRCRCDSDSEKAQQPVGYKHEPPCKNHERHPGRDAPAVQVFRPPAPVWPMISADFIAGFPSLPVLPNCVEAAVGLSPQCPYHPGPCRAGTTPHTPSSSRCITTMIPAAKCQPPKECQQ